ncbi:restriction endonuclease subunit S [Polaromonas sp. LjRoot131]|uniref:restriction endonuclease subunit S n=1 Tax=Polaromonas sp. LjRoot131 TaxID=3342262 RepID=UPI003ECDC43A
MAAEQFITEHLDLWTAAIKRRSTAGRGSSSKAELYGIKKLRELILELAVRGLLVAQDPQQEPASELLKKIAAERAKLVKDGKIKADKLFPPIAQDEAPFAIPSGWALARLADVINVLNGRAYKKHEMLSEGTPLLRVGNLFTSNEWYFSDLELEPEKYIDDGDLIYAWSASFGPFIWQGGRVIYHYHIWKMDFFSKADVNKYYFRHYLQAISAAIKESGNGIAMIHMTKERMEKLVLPIPPLAEQHRIVAKVDELMTLCDQLERQTDASVSAHQTLVETLLNTLTSAVDHAQFAISWQRIAEHFDTLFTTEESIDRLTQTILQLAVMGKLVAQDPADEPASELLKKITTEKTKLAKEGKIKSDKPLTAIAEEEKPFVLPIGWSWSRFDSLIDPEYQISYGVLVPGPDVEDGIPFVRIEDLSLKNPSVQPNKKISPDVDQQYARTRLVGGEILMGVVGSIGKLGIAPESWRGANIARAVCRIVPTKFLHKEYIVQILQSNFMRKSFIGDTRTLAQPTLNIGFIRDTLTPVPPFAEQLRIVAKVNELMVLCDRLGHLISEAQATQVAMVDAIQMGVTSP